MLWSELPEAGVVSEELKVESYYLGKCLQDANPLYPIVGAASHLRKYAGTIQVGHYANNYNTFHLCF